MMLFVRKKTRLLSLLGLLFLSQCCCIVVPFQARSKQEIPIVRQIVQKAENVLPDQWFAAGWSSSIDRLVVR